MRILRGHGTSIYENDGEDDRKSSNKFLPKLRRFHTTETYFAILFKPCQQIAYLDRYRIVHPTNLEGSAWMWHCSARSTLSCLRATSIDMLR